MNQGWTYYDQIEAIDAGQTILNYYCQKYHHSSPDEWQARINSGQISLNGKPTNTATILHAKDKLAYYRQPWVEPEVNLKFEVLYEDQELLLINKPSGLPVLPGGSFLEHTVLGQLKKHYPQDTPVPIHRLGRGTSGLLLLGRSQQAKSHLTQQIRNSTLKQDKSQINKVYRVLVSGNSIADVLSITQPIGKIYHPVLGYIYGATPQGKYARSDCQVIERYHHCTLLEVRIFTGRPHQIRIHLAAVGYPLLNDPLYIVGGTFAEIQPNQTQIPVPGDCGYFLHAYRLSFVHPRTLKPMNFTCAIPQGWEIQK